MSYYKATSVEEMPNQKNRENVEQAMTSNSRLSEEKAKMQASYASAECEYKNGNIKEGDAKLDEGRAAAVQAHKELDKEAQKKYNEYSEKYEEAYKNSDMSVANEYLKKRDDVLSKAAAEHQKIDDMKSKKEEQAKAQKAARTRS